jgi:hydrogenase maturation factor
MDAILSNLVRIGVVSSVDVTDSTKPKVRVIFTDKDMTSGWLYVLQHVGMTMTVLEGGLHSHEITNAVNETIEESGMHTHVSQSAAWVPKINDRVLVLYVPIFNGDGFVLGAI